MAQAGGIGDDDVEQLVASVPGVTFARVRRDADSGRRHLRVTLAPDAVADQVTMRIRATLAERRGLVIEPGAIRQRVVARSERAAALERATQGDPLAVLDVFDEADAAIDADEVTTMDGPDPHGRTVRPRLLDVDVLDGDVEWIVGVALQIGGDRFEGRVRCAATDRARRRGLARATVHALAQAYPEQFSFEVERVDCFDANVQPVMVSEITLVTETGPIDLVGASVVRGDHDLACARATLDAVNRQMALLADAG